MLASNLLQSVKKPLRSTKEALQKLPYYGTGRICPVCGRSSRKFRPFGVVPRADAECVHCGSHERHRLEWIFIQRETSLLRGSSPKVLHVAPEACFESLLRTHLGSSYLTADISNPRAMVKMDITSIQFEDETFDVILCSHVLEHVDDDRRAMREFFRVLKQDGWAILLVPISSERTFEDPTITAPAERLRLFGQKDHVRRYGPDYVDRLREAGFHVKIATVGDIVDSQTAVRMGLTDASGEIYYCTKGSQRS